MLTDCLQTDPVGLRLGSEQQGYREQSQGLPPVTLRKSTDVTVGSFSRVLHGTHPRFLELQFYGWVLAELSRDRTLCVWVRKCHNVSEGVICKVQAVDDIRNVCSLSFWLLANAVAAKHHPWRQNSYYYCHGQILVLTAWLSGFYRCSPLP